MQDTITIPMEEYKKLLEIKGSDENLILVVLILTLILIKN